MEKATSSESNARFNDEVLFLDGIIAFHPDVYGVLSDEEKAILKNYYLLGAEGNIPNIFDHRRRLLQSNPEIEQKAHEVFKKILNLLDIKEFTYTTQADTTEG